MKASDIRELTDEELEKSLEDLQKESMNLKIQAKLGKLENPSRIRIVRRHVAQIKTEKTYRKRKQLA